MFLAVIAPWGTKSYKKLPKSCLYGEKEVFLPLLIPFILNNMMKFVINSSVKLLFAAILIVNLYGCKHNSIIHELQSVDSLIANNQNSEALTQLKTIDSESLNLFNKYSLCVLGIASHE